MSARGVPPAHDPIRPLPTAEVEIAFEGRTYRGVRGQSIAGILLANNVIAWRTTGDLQAPRGLFCGIGICFDCVVTVDGLPDVRACLRRARGGEQVDRQHISPPIPPQDRRHE
jgi:D-hydroxyproline dehydrogenase subunit gamma